MSTRKYQPSNGTEGMIFMDQFCDRCFHQHPDPNHERQCGLIGLTMCYTAKDPEYPEEWTYDGQGNPICTKFMRYDWGKDDDGNWVDPVIEPPVPDNQLTLPFIFDEIGINDKTRHYECK